MKSCPRTKEYGLQGDSSKDAAAHLESCDVCRAREESWGRLKKSITAWDPTSSQSVTSDVQTAALVRRARKRVDGRVRRPGFGRWIPAYAIVGICVAVVGITAILSSIQPQEKIPTGSVESEEVELKSFELGDLISVNAVVADKVGSFEKTVNTSADGRLLVDMEGDRLGFGGDSRALISKTTTGLSRIVLIRGVVAVAARDRSQAEELIVEAAGATVSVVGTRFSVERVGDDVLVAVTEGRVRVGGSRGGEVLVQAGTYYTSMVGRIEVEDISPGDSLRVDALISLDEERTSPVELPLLEKTPPNREENASPPLAVTKKQHSLDQPRAESKIHDLKKLILSGELEEAEARLERILTQSPANADAWMLLATCRRKAGKWTEAVDALVAAAKHGTPRQEGRARFMAAVVLQDNLGELKRAGKLLEKYLDGAMGTRPLEPKALLRLIKIKLALGDQSAARKTSNQLKNRYPGTDETRSAMKLIGKGDL